MKAAIFFADMKVKEAFEALLASNRAEDREPVTPYPFSQQSFNTLNDHSIYYMLREFEKFVGFRVLAWFLTHPTGEIHINKLAREIGVSPGSVKSYADAFERDGLLTVTQLGTGCSPSRNSARRGSFPSTTIPLPSGS